VHNILINLILGDVPTIPYLAQFVGRLRAVHSVTIADMMRIHDRICLALGPGTEKDRQAVLEALLPIGTEFLREHKVVDLELDCAQVILVICRPLPDFRLPVVNYAVAVATHNPDCLDTLNAAIEKRFGERSKKFPVGPPIVVLASKLAFIPRSDEASVYSRLLLIFRKYQPEFVGSDIMIDEMFVTVRQWMTNEAGEFRSCAAQFALEIFPQMRLTGNVERNFFVDVFQRMTPSETESLITTTCGSCERCPKKVQNWERVLFSAKRAAFLVSDVWPEKKADILRRIPWTITNTYPKNESNWKKIVTVLLDGT
jgi:hypothetical protein